MIPNAGAVREPFPVTHEELDQLVDGCHNNPHSILGPHPFGGSVTVRLLRPMADSVTLITEAGRVPLTHEYRGVWCGVIPGPNISQYTCAALYDDRNIVGDDPYRFWPTLGEMDLHLIAEGRHEELWNVLGAHERCLPNPIDTTDGVSFAVWAPNARGVRVTGDFNFWDGIAHPMRCLGSSGVWELFVPNVGSGNRYKFKVLGVDGVWRTKADPVAFATQIPPANASVVFTSVYQWQDGDWLKRRAGANSLAGPMSIYEVHLGSWRAGLSYRELAEDLTKYLLETGFTHVEFLPVAEHPYGPSWGYQVTSYFAPTSRFGSPDDLRYLIDRLHQAGIGVLVDWVPAHFPKDEWALARFDGTPLYEHPDPHRGEHPDWGTYVFNYGRSEVRNFLVASALYWLEEFHADGLRVDAVASMIYLDYSRKAGEWNPNQFGGRENLDAVGFLQELNATVYKRVPGVIMIAEESTSWPGVTKPTDVGGLGFGLKWNMGWMHDALGYMRHEAIYRQYHHDEMTFPMMYAYNEHFVLPISHDEVVHGKGSLVRRMPGDRWQQLANLRAFLAFMWAHPGRKLLFMGSEFAQSDEWASQRSLDWSVLQFAEHVGILRTVTDLNRVYRENPALWQWDDDPVGFEWIAANEAEANVLTWVRWDSSGSPLVCAVNFSPTPRMDFPLGLPFAGRWNEVLNTDAVVYGGSGIGNRGMVSALAQSSHGQPATARVVLPPLAALYLTRD